jgi:hypothetical protein
MRLGSAILQIPPVYGAGVERLVRRLTCGRRLHNVFHGPWRLKGKPEVLKRIDDAEALLKSLRKTLSS